MVLTTLAVNTEVIVMATLTAMTVMAMDLMGTTDKLAMNKYSHLTVVFVTSHS